MNWKTTQTGTLYHCFENGVATCNGRIKDTGYGEGFKTLEEAAERVASWRVGSMMNGFKVCTKCEAKELAFQQRAAASMEASTGEGDVNPPADSVNVTGIKFTEFTKVAKVAPQVAPAEQKEEVPVARIKTAKVAPEFSPEVVEALRVMRAQPGRTSEEALSAIVDAIDVLDNAGIFEKIDEYTGYDVDECTCPADERERSGTDNHYIECPQSPVGECVCDPDAYAYGHERGCPSDPDKWGDLVYVSKVPGWGRAVNAQRKMNETRQDNYPNGKRN